MTSVELMQPLLGSAMIDLDSSEGVGFDECTLMNVIVNDANLSFDLLSLNKDRTFLVRFRGIKTNQIYKVSWNHHPAVLVKGSKLKQEGLLVSKLD